LGQIQESENRLYPAADSYRRVLQLAGDLPQPVVAEAYLGLARIFYQWNDLDAAEQYGQQGLQQARQFADIIDRSISGELFLARLKLARGDIGSAAALVALAEQSAREHNFLPQMPEIAGVQMIVLLHQGDLAAAAQLAQTYPLPISQARVCIAQGDPSAALAILEPLRQQVEAKNWQDELLKIMVLQVVAYHARGENEKAAQVLGEALVLTEPGGLIRTFVDEGEPMRFMLCDSQVSILRTSPHLRGYLEKLLAAFPAAATENPKLESKIEGSKIQGLVEPLSQRELEILKLIAQGLSNRAISARLFLALDTVKGHNRRIFDKLQVERRTEAIARARELGLL
jgi:LuxR family maltose regulon positive regulatory protein